MNHFDIISSRDPPLWDSKVSRTLWVLLFCSGAHCHTCCLTASATFSCGHTGLLLFGCPVVWSLSMWSYEREMILRSAFGSERQNIFLDTGHLRPGRTTWSHKPLLTAPSTVMSSICTHPWGMPHRWPSESRSSWSAAKNKSYLFKEFGISMSDISYSDRADFAWDDVVSFKES